MSVIVYVHVCIPLCGFRHECSTVQESVEVRQYLQVSVIHYLWSCLRQGLSFVVYLCVFQDIWPMNYREFSCPRLHADITDTSYNISFTWILGAQTQVFTLVWHHSTKPFYLYSHCLIFLRTGSCYVSQAGLKPARVVMDFKFSSIYLLIVRLSMFPSTNVKQTFPQPVFSSFLFVFIYKNNCCISF